MQTPFIGPSYNLESRPASVQRTINLIPVPLEPGNERAPWVLKDVPGLATFFELPTALLLLHMDGPDGSGDFIDNSINAFTITSLGAAITTSTSVFGGASGTFDGTNDRLLTPATSLFDPNSVDFTIDARVRLTNNSNLTYPIISQQEGGTANGWMLFLVGVDHRLAFASGPGASQIYTATSGGVVVDTWTAVSVSKEGSTIRLYQDGAIVGSFTYVPGSISLTGQNVMVGFGLGGNGTIWEAPEFRWHQGQLDELRYVTGTALYTGDSYVLATTEFPNA
jgi:hypothetical protein